MRVQIVSQYFDPEIGAPQLRLRAFVRELVRRGHQVDVVTALPNHPEGRIFEGYRGRLSRRERRDGADVRRVWVHAAVGSGRGRILNYVTFMIGSAWPILRHRRPDVVVVESPPLFAAVTPMLDRYLRRRPFALWVADLWPDTVFEMGMARRDNLVGRMMIRLERLAYRSAAIVAPVTEQQLATLRDAKGVPADKLILANNGIDLDLFGAARDEARDTDEPVIVYAGTVGFAQGIDVIVDAAPVVRASIPRARFVIIGNGSERDRIARRVVDERIEGVEVLPARPLEEVADLYRTAAVGVIPLRSSPTLEGARPVKLFSMMAASLPIVFSGRGEGAGIVERSGAGVAVPPEDPAALASAIVSLLRDPDRRTKCGLAGRQLVEREFSWSTTLGPFIDELERRFGGSGGGVPAA